MKINNLGRLNVNPYNKQMEKMEQVQKLQKEINLKFLLKLLELQKENSFEIERQEKVEQLKEKVQSGEYEVNPREVAKKMYGFWNLD